jgi:FkbM family methyltransferase
MAKALRKAGYLVTPNRMQAERFSALVPDVEIVVDVGIGMGGTAWLYDAFPGKTFILVDPIQTCGDGVAKRHPTLKHTFHCIALGSQEGTAQLNIPFRKGATRYGMASLLTRTDQLVEHISDIETLDVPVRTLDSLMADHPGSFGLKIDSEGSEADILRSGSEALSRCDFVVLELSVSERFAEVEPPSAVIAILAQAGLELRDVLAVSGGTETGSPRHIDCLFTRWRSPAIQSTTAALDGAASREGT